MSLDRFRCGDLYSSQTNWTGGSGLLSVQGTSFAFLGAILTAGFIVKGQGGGPDEILATIFGICFVGAFIEIILSRFIHLLKKSSHRLLREQL
jgi:xanthine permease XanP